MAKTIRQEKRPKAVRDKKKEHTVIHLHRNATSRTVLFCSCIAILAYRMMLDSDENLRALKPYYDIEIVGRNKIK